MFQKSVLKNTSQDENLVDNIIDKMVYGLYGLSEEEIKIVENN